MRTTKDDRAILRCRVESLLKEKSFSVSDLEDMKGILAACHEVILDLQDLTDNKKMTIEEQIQQCLERR